MAGGYRVIGSAPVKVIDESVTLSGPEHAAGSRSDRSGPGNQGDFISIDPIGSDDRYGGYAYALASTQAEPVKVKAPGPATMRCAITWAAAIAYLLMPIASLPSPRASAPKEVVAGTVRGRLARSR
jgi:hypothetical protein